MFHLDRLPGQEKDEKTLLFLRRHPFVLFKATIGFIFLSLVPVAFYYLYSTLGQQIVTGPVSSILVITGGSIFYLGILVFLFNTFLDYYLDVWIVTNHRIINIEQKNLFSRVVSEQALYRVQDVTAVQKGILATFLKYGTIIVQTAAEQQRFVFKEVPLAFENAKKIQQLVLLDKQLHPGVPGV